MPARSFTSFVIFAEMRTGSNFLESNLNRLDGLTCHGEAFNPDFIGAEGKTELFGVTLDARGRDPKAFLQILREQTKGLSGFRYFNDHDPRVFDLVMDDPACAKVILTRNQLESYVSWKIAKESDQWWLANTKHLKTVRPHFDVQEFAARLDALHAFQRRLVRRLQVTGQTAYYIDYEDILDLDVLNGLAGFLGVAARLKELDLRFKKQNPEPLGEKVANPDEMAAGLRTLDVFGLDRAPNFEPRRQPTVPLYVASADAPLIFMPVKGGPEWQVRKWMRGLGPVVTDMNRQALRQWKAAHPGQRSFTVLRHPLARAHAVWSDFLEKEWMPELRPYLKRVHRFELPPKGHAIPTAEAYRDSLLVFLELARHILSGRTELRVHPFIATQEAILQGFGSYQPPDFILREDRLHEGLSNILSGLGHDMPPLPEPAVPRFSLAGIYDRTLEEAARQAYGRDYVGFGFGDWPDHAA